ncbi:MAG: NAD-dependent epimerase/dehydratase family protein [Candidatus Thorarchaeota archaeon]
MKILLTGAFGNVGLSTLKELVNRNYDVRIFDIKNRRNMRLALKYKKDLEIFWGDLRNYKDVEEAVSDIDVVIHVAAIIPPLADKKPKFAESVNVGGTKSLLKAMEKLPIKPKLIFTSSVAVYGDRLENPYITLADKPNPNPHDEYAKQKIKCEEIIMNSSLEWVILRLTYIVSLNKLQMDPLMFEMPLDTSIEICDSNDVGLALTNAVESHEIWGRILHIAGGERCRIPYRDYLNQMFDIFGVCFDELPEEAFSKKGFHCGFMSTEISQALLNYQRYTLDDYFDAVKKKVAISRLFTYTFKPIVQKFLLNKSHYYRDFLRNVNLAHLNKD